MEPEKGRFAFEEIEQTFHFEEWRAQGVKINLRIVLDYPSDVSHMDIPDWLYEEIDEAGVWYDDEYGQGFSPDYANTILIRYHERLIAEVARRYNADPLIAFVQLGSIGHWGEWHTMDEGENPIDFPGQRVTDQYAGHYVRYFTNKPLLMRRPHEIALNHKMGLYNDAFGKRDATVDGFYDWYKNGYVSWLTQKKEPAMPDFWKNAPSGGEFSANVLNYFSDAQIKETLYQAQLTHVSWMGPNSPVRAEAGGPLQANIDRFLKTIGYRFVLYKTVYEEIRKPGDTLHIRLLAKNKGIAPFYFRWPLELTLADASGKVVSSIRSGADIRKWLPGTNEAIVHLPIARGLAPGTYELSAAIVDPVTGQPGIDFANEGRTTDGRYKIGELEVIQ
ncbi:DUF4832 domain-containing protein [Paenibacillus methanolicus]|uniref:DUF4832 domain-containing protein n=1 Tax=Paenibacillus methanolicus TaxID=582686 RepID=UPI001652CFBA|nr:DUF4832 domain-containing protein [Paenibacillus methanolicus]